MVFDTPAFVPTLWPPTGAGGPITTTSWALLLVGPLLFLVGIVGVSAVFALGGLEPERISERVQGLVPQLLLGVLLALGVLFALLRPDATLGIWSFPTDGTVVVDVVVGTFSGLLLAALYFARLESALEALQRSAGDFVPPGSVLATVSGNLPAFFLANVVAAPVVEETLYRGFAIPLLTAHYGVAVAVAGSCLLFGALHWPGGIWYVLLTGAVAGGLFAALFLWSGGIWAPLSAHASLNLLEFLVAWRRRTGGPVTDSTVNPT